MRTALILTTLVAVCLSIPAKALAKEHPYLFFQKSDIPALKAKIANDPVAAKAMAKIEKNLKGFMVSLPPVNADIRGAWASSINRNGRQARYAAFCYLMTGKPEYLAIARKYLLTWAEHFDNRVNFHALDDKSYMRIYFTGRLGITTAWTYDMIYDELTPAERKLIEDKFLRGIVEMVRTSSSDGNGMAVKDFEWNGGQWNGVNYGNAGIAAIGFALDDPAVYEHAVTNWKTYLARDMLTDGLWFEEDFVYANFCFAAMVAVAEMAHQSGYPEDLWNAKVPSKPADQWDERYGKAFPSQGEDPGYRRMRAYLDAQLDYQYPTLAGGNWGWQMNSAKFMANSSYTTFFELARQRIADSGYEWFVDRLDRARGDGRAWSRLSPILYHEPLGANLKPRPSFSRLYDHAGWVALKSIEGEKYWGSDSIYAFMPFGIERSKGLQRLSLDLFAFGKVVAPRVAKLSRHQSADEAFYLRDPSWNNVMVDGENISIRRHKIVDSKVRFHEFTPEFKIVQPVVTLERHVVPSIWDGKVSERRPDRDFIASRLLGLTDTYLLDIAAYRFIQEPDRRHEFDYIWHGAGELSLEGVRHDDRTKDPWAAVWRDRDGIGLKTHMLGSGKPCLTRVLWQASPHGQYIRAPRSVKQTAFVAIHEPFKGEPKVTAVEELLNETGRVVVKVRSEAFTDYLAVAYDADSVALKSPEASIAVSEQYGYLRVADDTITGRGRIDSFALNAPGVKRVVINGEPVECKIDGDTVSWSAR